MFGGGIIRIENVEKSCFWKNKGGAGVFAKSSGVNQIDFYIETCLKKFGPEPGSRYYKPYFGGILDLPKIEKLKTFVLMSEAAQKCENYF